MRAGRAEEIPDEAVQIGVDSEPGGDRGTRTPNLGIANAALSQLSYIPTQLAATSRL